jgi:putative methyltransferase (TIGR04325 family)
VKNLAVSAFQLLRSFALAWRFPYGCYRGQYSSFQTAIAAAPTPNNVGFNHENVAQDYRRQFSTYIGYYDYPVLMWLKDLLTEGAKVFDFGGNIGTHFYGYETRLTYPSGLIWTICELPEIVKVGQDFAQEQQRSELQFTTDFSHASGSDILLGSGSIQYFEGSFADQIAGLAVKPKHLLLNRLPLCQGESFVSLQNGGLVYYPVKINNKAAFIGSLQQIGYELVDDWLIHSEPVAVPFHPEFTSLCFSGLYLRMVESFPS